MARKKGSPADREAAVKSARRIANFNVPADGGDTSPGGSDPPIIVQGGNSVHVEMPHSFSDDGAGADHKRYKHNSGTLAEVVIDGGAPIPLNKKSRIEIRYK